MVLTAFIDDSGRNDPPVFVLAGLMAQPEQWVRFSDLWKEILAIAPSLDYFKMHEASALTGQFDRARGWTETLRDERVMALAEITRLHAIAAFSAVVFHDDYEKYMGGRVNRFMDHPYFLTYGHAIYAAIKWQIDRQ